ncbi:MAG: excinuclease ABC subunit A [Alphaproteobacteria bacterium]|jgi:excinuclease ABC subunit A|nr:excinuclease ABC subunit A [Alphaproteobacteria bacterium]PPR13326.1 MAG: UvrABC system protein A [Alphaproteobacteria bacterium MarineAlpha12_Bin1]|tara:strand:- start:7708 stop:10539 length:2832 start_codon:yes stop_codon:yes gene_type:complete
MHKKIIVRGAREHNLKNVDIELPRDSLVVITGLSGSGKSSLAFDTIYAEGQRRYVESLSAYARQFLELMQKPNVDSIEGLSPAISIEQKTSSRNPRSTVGTVTEIYDYLRLLYARIGVPYSPATGLPIEAQSVSQMVDSVMELHEGTRLYILSPIARRRKGEFRKELEMLQKRGFQRVKINDEMFEIDQAPKLDKNYWHDIEAVVDRIVIRPGLESRLADSFETALQLSDGLAITENADNSKQKIYSAKFACPVSGFTIEEIEPRLFSFNNPHGACPECDGLGSKVVIDAELVVPDKNLSLNNGAIVPWSKSSSPYYLQTLNSIVEHYNSSMDKPWKQLKKEVQKSILYGSGETPILIKYNDGTNIYETEKPFEGVISNLERRLRETDRSWIREEIVKYQTTSICQVCEGSRLKPEALAVKVNNLEISKLTEMSISDAAEWFQLLPSKLSSKQNEIGERILREVIDRLKFLNDVGLEYLTLDRSAGTLSGGESQRIRLASQIGSGLTGVLYVLDEPSIGLHQRDNERLLNTLKRLRDLGNTVIVVEHDEEAIRSADYLIDMGPGAGVNGGEIVANGTPEKVIKQTKKSLTAKYLSGIKKIPTPNKRRSAKSNQFLKIDGAEGNNLRKVNVKIPLGTFTCVTGVSGSGKSSLIIETLFKSAARQLMKSRYNPSPYKTINGLDNLDKVIDINQSPIGRTPRSNPATYTGAFSPIRDWFTNLPEARARGYKPGRFSFNVKGGRCETCQGDGVIKIEMHFLPDIYVECEVCRGKRYNRETLEVVYRDKSIADILNMTVEEGCIFFKAVPSIKTKLDSLMQVGLGYVKIGQPATTLSGGEAQRVKLAKELSKRSTGRTLYILDEPTTGLHYEDVRKLLDVLHTLVDQGNTIIVIEHNLEVIKTADWIIDMGPEGGHRGGKIIASGTPENLIKSKASYTGQYLSSYLKQ